MIEEVTEQSNESSELEFEQPLEEEIEVISLPSSKRKVYTDQGDPEAVTRGNGERWRGDSDWIPRKNVRRVLAEGDVGLRELLGGKQQEGGPPH